MPKPLVCTGVIAIDPELLKGSGPAIVVTGPNAGRAFALDIEDWKSTYWFLRKQTAVELGHALPEEVVDLTDRPLLAQATASARLVLVQEEFAQKADYALAVGHHRTTGVSTIAVRRGEKVRSFEGLLLDASGLDEDEGEALPLHWLFEGILKTLTDGEDTMLDVSKAYELSTLEMQDHGSLELELEQLQTMEAPAELALQALEALETATADSIPLPGTGQARRLVVPGYTLSDSEDSKVIGGPIAVDRMTLWEVKDVHAHCPPERQRRIKEFKEHRARDNAGEAMKMWVLLAGAVAIVLGLLLAIS